LHAGRAFSALERQETHTVDRYITSGAIIYLADIAGKLQFGGMAEWFKATVCKVVFGEPNGSSNLPP
jgi:hypothetical protein